MPLYRVCIHIQGGLCRPCIRSYSPCNWIGNFLVCSHNGSCSFYLKLSVLQLYNFSSSELWQNTFLCNQGLPVILGYTCLRKIFNVCIQKLLYPNICKISKNHSIFIPGCSTTSNLCHFTQFTLDALSLRLQVDTTYIDSAKAIGIVCLCNWLWIFPLSCHLGYSTKISSESSFISPFYQWHMEYFFASTLQ